MALFMRKLVLLLPIPLIVLGLNYIVDPAHLFWNDGYERHRATRLLAGQSVFFDANGDFRLLQKRYPNV